MKPNALGGTGADGPLLRHEMLCAIPTFLVETILNLAGIPGESRDSGCNPGLDAMAKKRGIPERFPGRVKTIFQIRDQG